MRGRLTVIVKVSIGRVEQYVQLTAKGVIGVNAWDVLLCYDVRAERQVQSLSTGRSTPIP